MTDLTFSQSGWNLTRFEKYFRYTTQKLLSEYNRSKNINHNGLKGYERELLITNFLKNIFPNKFVIDTGEIIDSRDKVSKHADIIIYDESIPVLSYGSVKHFLSAGVFNHIEVKSKLTKLELRKALKITDSIKLLDRDFEAIDSISFKNPSSKYINSCIFAYEASMSGDKLLEYLVEYHEGKLNPSLTVDLICVLDKYILTRIQQESGEREYIVLPAGEDSLLLSLVVLKGSMLDTSLRSSKYFAKYYERTLARMIAKHGQSLQEQKVLYQKLVAKYTKSV